MTRKTREKESTAIHEAGHAVVSIATRRRFKFVTIVPNGDSLGHVLFGRPPVEPSVTASLDYLTRSLAGHLAERQFGYRPHRAGWEQDRHSAVTHALEITGDPHEADLWIRIARIRADRYLTIWRPSVEALADRLMAEPTIGWEDARQTVFGAKGARV